MPGAPLSAGASADSARGGAPADSQSIESGHVIIADDGDSATVRAERLGALTATAFAPGRLVWREEENFALAEAGSTGRGVFIQFAAAWCEACVALEQHTLRAPELWAVLDRGYVPLRLDVSDVTPATRAALAHYGVTALPLMLVLDTQGREVDRIAEPLPVEALVQRLRAAQALVMR